MSRCPAILLLLLLPTVVAAQSGPQKPVFLEGEAKRRFLAQIEKEMGKLESIAASFTQEKHISLFDGPVTSSGILLFSRPDSLRSTVRATGVPGAIEWLRYRHAGPGRPAASAGSKRAPSMFGTIRSLNRRRSRAALWSR